MASTKSFSRFGLYGGASAAVLSLWLAATPVAAQQQMRAFGIKAGDLGPALNAFARQSDQEILFTSAIVAGKRTAGVSGRYEPRAALTALLAGTGVQVASANGSVVTLRGEGGGPQAEAAADSAVAVDQVLVTGSRIRGAPQASPVVVLTAKDIQNAGQHDLGEVIRSLPQNFAGGVNPASGTRSGSSSSDFGGASTLNLRGIGRDATLTLLNGHRLSANANGGVDITAIPLAALERLEIVTDGASALYGSDAVGGVANLITKRAFTGLNVTALYGGSTDGGYEQTQLSAVSGREWTGGGLIAAVTNARNSQITAGQRSYTTGMNPGGTLFPKQDRTNIFSSAYQDIGHGVTVGIDGLYSYNRSLRLGPITATAPILTSGRETDRKTWSYSLTPTIAVDLPHDWRLNAYGSIAEDRLKAVITTRNNGTTTKSVYCYCNAFKSAEVNLAGDAFALPPGSVKLALGGGYREEKAAFAQTGSTVRYSETQGITYGFGELAIPVVGAEQGVPLVRALNLSAAVRYEDYAGAHSIATPKLGVIYNLDEQLTVKASWGKSFKAASFNQRYSSVVASLNPVAGYGSQFPAGSTFIVVQGSRPDLKPEKATSFTAAVIYQPKRVQGLEVSVGYYHIDFDDRVVEPFASSAGVLTNPLYDGFVTRNPSAQQQAAAIARSPTSLVNQTSGPYDPTKVIAIVDRSLTNATSQEIDGFDASLTYQVSLQNGSDVSFSTTSTYLDIRQQLIPTVAPVGLTGNFFFPRHLMSRSGITWSDGDLTVSGFVNYSGAARYRAVTPIQDVKAVTTLDLTAKVAVPRLAGTEIGISAINILNAKPTVIPPTTASESSFDATAYAVTGRLITASISKSF